MSTVSGFELSESLRYWSSSTEVVQILEHKIFQERQRELGSFSLRKRKQRDDLYVVFNYLTGLC